MPGQSSSPYGETDSTGADSAPATATASSGGSIRWAPHGRAMTACLVAVNVALVALVYLYFWRVFSRKRAASSSSAAAADDDDEEDGASSASTSVPSSPARAAQQDDEEQQRRHDRLVASLPAPFVARPGAGAGADCAVCIAELRDGDEARALPRCGHRFHAACVDAWLRRRHTTCPLCRASVVVIAAAEVAGSKGGGVTGTAAAAAPEDVDAPV